MARTLGFAALTAFAATVPASNWLIQNVGWQLDPHGPHLIPVGFGLMAPSGVLAVGVAFTLRDLVQRTLGLRWAFGAVLAGGVVSALLAPPSLVTASVVAFLLGEVADLAVYTPLARRGLLRAVLASNAVGIAIDSAVFLVIAFGTLEYLPGQVVGKVWMTAAALPFLWSARTTEERNPS